jgi:hypothetical protein
LILDYFPLNKDFKVAFIGGQKGTLSVLLNHENLISDTFKINQEYLKVFGLLKFEENQYRATTDLGLLSFTIHNSKLKEMEVKTSKSKKRYDLASVNGKILYMKPMDVVRDKLKWRVLNESEDIIIYESDAKFKNFKGVNLPHIWNRLYYIDSQFVFNDPLNNCIITYNATSNKVDTINYSSPENELRVFYYDSVSKKTYLVGFQRDGKNYKVYEFSLSEPSNYFLIKSIQHLQPPKSIHNDAVFVEDLFLESGKNCIVRIPLN